MVFVKKDASLLDAVNALVHSTDRFCGRAIRIEDDDDLVEDTGFLDYCTEHDITIIQEQKGKSGFYDFNKRKRYYVSEITTYASWDATTLELKPVKE